MPVYKFNDGRKGWYFSFMYNGKRYKKEIWNKQKMLTKQDALACEYECKQQLIDADNQTNSNMLLSSLYDEYIKNTKASLKSSTLYNYDKFKNNYLVLCVNKSIKDLTPNDIMDFKTKVIDLDVEIEFKNRIIKTMKNVLAYGQMMYDITGKLQIPLLEILKDNQLKTKESKDVYMPPNVFIEYIKPLKDIPNGFYYESVIKVLYHTGMRIGELAALTLADYDNKFLNINKDYIRVSSKDVIQPPKNDNSIRKIPLSDEMVILLDNYISYYNITEPSDILFKLDGKFLNQQRLRRVMNNLSALGFEQYNMHPHSLRHSFNTNLKNAGVDVYTRARLLGNTPEVNAETYTHTQEIDLLKAIQKMYEK